MKPPIVPVLLVMAGLSVPVSAQLPPPDAALPVVTVSAPAALRIGNGGGGEIHR